MSVSTRPTCALASLLLMALVGCGNPYAEPAPPQGEQPGAPLPGRRDRVARRELARTPEDAARRAAELATNWTGETVAGQYSELAQITVGPARRSARETAARLPSDPYLGAPGARSSGSVEAVVIRPGGGRRHELVVVTRETLVADGLRDDRWRVTLAAAERRGGGWVISRWEAQP